jgi:hypothetical protein
MTTKPKTKRKAKRKPKLAWCHHPVEPESIYANEAVYRGWSDNEARARVTVALAHARRMLALRKATSNDD